MAPDLDDDNDSGHDAYLSSSNNDEHITSESAQTALAGRSGVVESHYDPERTKKIYAPKSKELQERVKKLWDRYSVLSSMLRPNAG